MAAELFGSVPPKKIAQSFFSSDSSRQQLTKVLRTEFEEFQAQTNQIISKREITYSKYLVDNEIELAAKYPNFHGVRYHLFGILNAFGKVNDEIQKFKNRDKPTDSEIEKLHAAIMESNVKQFAFSCFAYFDLYGTQVYTASTKQLYNTLGNSFKTPFEKAGYNPHDVCFSSSSSQIEMLTKAEAETFLKNLKGKTAIASPEQNVNGFATRKNIQKIWAPVKLEIAITLASAPFIILSSGAGTAAASGLAKAGASLATKYAIKTAVTRAAVWAGTQAIKLATEVFVFSVANRLLSNVMLTALAKIDNDESYLALRKSMFASYTHEMITGIPIFLGLHGIGKFSQKLASRLALKESSYLVQGIDLAGQVGVITSATIAEQQIEHLMKRKENDPLFKEFNGTEFFKNLGRTTAILLTLRVAHGSHSPQVAEPGKEVKAIEKSLENLAIEDIAL